MRAAVVSTNVSRRRLRPGWASGLATAISRRTQRDEERDAMARLVRSVRWCIPAFAQVAATFDAAAEALGSFGSAWRRLNRKTTTEESS